MLVVIPWECRQTGQQHRKSDFLINAVTDIRVHVYHYKIIIEPQKVTAFSEISTKMAIIRGHVVTKVYLHLYLKF